MLDGPDIDGGMMYFLYEILFPNTKRYIGITNYPARRWSAHKAAAKRGSTKQKVSLAIRKYGEDNISFKILVQGTEEYIRELERKAISIYKTREHAYGYNLALGGEMSPVAGIGHTVASKLKMSISQKKRIHTPEEISKMAASLKGRVFSDEHRHKLSVSATGRKLSKATRQKISETNRKADAYNKIIDRKPRQKTLQRLETVADLLKENSTAVEIAEKLGCTHTYALRLIRKCLNSQQPILPE